MAVGEYDSAVALAIRLIAKKGRMTTFNQLGGADVSTPWKNDAPAVVNSVTQPAVFVSLSIKDWGFDLTQEDLEKRATQAILTATGPMDLTLAHQVVDGAVYSILWVKILKPGPAVVIYAIGIAR